MIRIRTTFAARLGLVLGALALTAALAPAQDGADPAPASRPDAARAGQEKQDKPARDEKKSADLGDAAKKKPVQGVAQRGQDAKPAPDPAGAGQEGADAKAPAKGGPPPRAQANRLAQAVKLHEVRFARLDKLIAVFRERGDATKLARAEALRAREAERYQTELAAFKQSLGDETYQKVLASLRVARKQPDAKKPDAPAPDEKERGERDAKREQGSGTPPARDEKKGGRR